MKHLLKLIADDFVAYARECGETWDSLFGAIDRTITGWASQPKAARAIAPASDDDEPLFPFMEEQPHSEDPILEMQRLGLLDHRSSWDATDTDMFDHSSGLFDDSSISCNSLDLFNDTTCIFDDSSSGSWE